jgi:hypothetical protein
MSRTVEPPSRDRGSGGELGRAHNFPIVFTTVMDTAMPQSQMPSSEPMPSADQTGATPCEHGWHLSSFDLRDGLMVVEAADDEALSLFGELLSQ